MKSVRNDFPYFANQENPVFLDTAASAQKPKKMIDKMMHFYSHEYSNIHRGDYDLSARATYAFESVRKKVAKFINVSANEIVFTKNATEAINIVAFSYVSSLLSEGDEILVSSFEHHSNLVPWQQIAREKQSQITIMNINIDGSINISAVKKQISNKTKFIAVTHMSNVLGYTVELEELSMFARSNNIPILVDACQSAVHLRLDKKKFYCDFLVFSAHKLYGPCGVGILYINTDVIKYLLPYQTGGGMVKKVMINKSSFVDLPGFLEAGTPAIASVIAFGATLDYLVQIKWWKFLPQEHYLSSLICDEVKTMPQYKIFSDTKSAIISFSHSNINYNDLGFFLNKERIAVRTGSLCAIPLVRKLKVDGLVRISLGIYNNENDIHYFLKVLYKIQKFF